MKGEESRLVYEDMKRRDKIVKEIESLRPSDNPFVSVVGIFVTAFVFVWAMNAFEFASSPEKIFAIFAVYVIVNQVVLQEISRRTHRRIDALYKLLISSTAQ